MFLWCCHKNIKVNTLNKISYLPTVFKNQEAYKNYEGYTIWLCYAGTKKVPTALGV